jgi:DNA uptake protein ComE-like DNA-binding protein
LKHFTWTPAEKKVVWFSLLCLLIGSAVLLAKTRNTDPSIQAKKERDARVIRERLAKTDHSGVCQEKVQDALDLNQATERELARLPGLGPILAKMVVQDRSAHGPFGSIAELRRVRALSPKRIEVLSPYLYVSPGQAWVSAPSSPTPGGKP